ncbi:unnamed protein product, partial [Nezara viridula]
MSHKHELESDPAILSTSIARSIKLNPPVLISITLGIILYQHNRWRCCRPNSRSDTHYTTLPPFSPPTSSHSKSLIIYCASLLLFQQRQSCLSKPLIPVLIEDGS